MGRTGMSAYDKMRAAVPKPTCPCGKVSYRKKRQAKREADRLARQSTPRRRPNLRPYQCHTGAWHLTSQPRLPNHMRYPADGD